MLHSPPPLIYVSDDMPGYTRRRWGRGFSIRDADNQVVRDKSVLERIRSLVIPPAWQEVWISPLENGHLQCTGRDPKRRKQYIYHQEYLSYRQAAKFRKIFDFAGRLPGIRQQLETDLQRSEWDRRKVLALAVSVLDNVHLRIGNQQYAERNQTYGLTTLRRRHLDFEDGDLTFSYKGKSNQFREVNVEDRDLISLIRECSELPGYEVFRYKTGYRSYETVDSREVNDYIHDIAGDRFSAKDFRTWAGTQYAVEHFAEAKERAATEARKNLTTEVVRAVANELGNTVSVCREYYIHPAVLAAVEEERIPDLSSVSKKDFERFDQQFDPAEVIAYDLISAARRD